MLNILILQNNLAGEEKAFLRINPVHSSCGPDNKPILTVLILSPPESFTALYRQHPSMWNMWGWGGPSALCIWSVLCTAALSIKVKEGTMRLSTAHLWETLCKVFEDLHVDSQQQNRRVETVKRL